MPAQPTRIVDQRTSHKGRGAQSNRSPRYQPACSQWDDGIEGPSPVTECRPVEAASIIARNRSPDIPFDQSINPYQGCEHGCIYCYARPTHAYLDLSPGLDFETRLTRKTNAAQLLRRELGRPGYRCRSITLGANTDPYQPVEREYRITRQVLEVLHECRHPVSIITKGALITRDLDLLADMAAEGLASVAISITTLEADLKRSLEPRAPSAGARLDAMAQLNEAGVPVSVLFAPVIPALNDSEMERVLARAREAGATRAAYILLRLPLEIRELFAEWLEQYHPLRAGHIMSLMRQSRGGRDYDSRFGQRMRGTGHFAGLLGQRFRLSCKKLGLNMERDRAARCDLFRPPRAEPSPDARDSSQMSLFD